MSSQQRNILILLAVLILGWSRPATARVWETADGKLFKAELVSYINGVVILRMEGGGKSLYSIKKISEADRAYVRETFPDGDRKKSSHQESAAVNGYSTSESLPGRGKVGAPTAKRQSAALPPASSGALNYKVGQSAPSVSGQYPNGAKTVSLEQLRGKVVVIDFWATWCGPCRVEMPRMIQLYEKYHDSGFEIIGVSLDKSWKPVTQYRKSQGMQWPIALDKFRYISKKWGIQSIPTLVLIDQNGVIVADNLRAGTLEPYLRKYLGIR